MKQNGFRDTTLADKIELKQIHSKSKNSTDAALKNRNQTIESLLSDVKWANEQIEFLSEPKKAKFSFEDNDEQQMKDDDDDDEKDQNDDDEKDQNDDDEKDKTDDDDEKDKDDDDEKDKDDDEKDKNDDEKDKNDDEEKDKDDDDDEKDKNDDEKDKDGDDEKDKNDGDEKDKDDDDEKDKNDGDEKDKDDDDEKDKKDDDDEIDKNDADETYKKDDDDEIDKNDDDADETDKKDDDDEINKNDDDADETDKKDDDDEIDKNDDDADETDKKDDDDEINKNDDDADEIDKKDDDYEFDKNDDETDKDDDETYKNDDETDKNYDDDGIDKDDDDEINKNDDDADEIDKKDDDYEFDKNDDETDKDDDETYKNDDETDKNYDDDEIDKDDDDENDDDEKDKNDDDDEKDEDDDNDDDENDDEKDEDDDENDDDDKNDDEKDEDDGDDDDDEQDKNDDDEKDNEDQGKRTKMKKEVHIKNKNTKRDINNNKIYYRKVLKCKFGRNGERKKRETVWNQAHACKFCGLIKTNISKHLRKHKNQKEMKDLNYMISSLGKKHKHVKAKWDLLRSEGDHKHNLKVQQEGEGEIILARRSHEKFDISEYGPCPGCFVWLKMGKTLVNHQKRCPANALCGNQIIKLTKKELHVRSLEAANKLSSVASRALKQEVFTIMTDDKISEIAKSDPLIICLGNLWLLKNVGNRLKRKYYASARMRDAARYLIHLRNETGCSKHSMEEFLRPEYFNSLVRCALLTASPQLDDEEDLKSPSTALKIGYDLKRMIAAKWAEAIKTQNPEKVSECKDLFKLIKFEWSIKVTKLATTTLSYRRFNKEHSLPEANDLVKLQQHIKGEIKQLNLEDTGYLNYRRVGVLAETRILLFNKRRSGEVEGMRVSEYLRRKDVTNIEKSMREGLTALENHLLTSQDMIEVRGKNGRGVPVIVPSDTKALYKYLANAENRSNAEIYDSNRYLFPNAKHGVLRAYDSLKSLCKEIELSKPHKITSVNMRKYTATIAQIFDLNPNQHQWLLNHLGHSMDVHKIHYRQTSGLIERIDMAKIMLMQEFDLTSKYAGKKLHEIQLDEIVFKHTVDDCDVSTQDLTEALDLDNNDIPNADDDFQPVINDAGKDVFSFTDDEDDDYDNGPKKTRSKNVSTRVRWSKEEETEITKFFQEYFTTKTTPGREACEKIIRKSKILKRRSWETLKKKVWNMIKKM